MRKQKIQIKSKSQSTPGKKKNSFQFLKKSRTYSISLRIIHHVHRKYLGNKFDKLNYLAGRYSLSALRGSTAAVRLQLQRNLQSDLVDALLHLC